MRIWSLFRDAGIKTFLTKCHNYLLNKKTALTEFWYARYYGKKIILLESQQLLSGNSGALYEYLREKKEYRSYTFVCLLRRFDRSSFRNKRRILAFQVDARDPKKRWLSAHALIAFYDDVPIRPGNNQALTIYLTHGCPALKSVKGIINVPEYVDYAICTSDNMIPLMSQQFSFPQEKFVVCGLPRNDVLFGAKKDISALVSLKETDKVILWTPTFRKVINGIRNDSMKPQPFDVPLLETWQDVQKLDTFLAENHLIVLIKPHPYQDVDRLKQLSGLNRIHILYADQIVKHGITVNDLFPHTDALISDYSSIAFDYLLIDRPVAYVMDDVEDYKLGLVSDYESLTPGPKLKTLDDFFEFLKQIARGKDEFAAERSKVRDYVHSNPRGGYCERIEELFLRNIQERKT